MILACLLTLLFLVTFLGKGLDLAPMLHRLSMWAVGLAMLLGLAAPNPWMGAFIACSSLCLIPHEMPSAQLKDAVYWSLALAGGYVAIAPFLERWMIPFILGAILVLGIVLSVIVAWNWTGGQGNTNHLEALAALAMASAVGLMEMGWLWAGLTLPLLAWPLIHRYTNRMHAFFTTGQIYKTVSQGQLYVLVLVGAWLTLHGPLLVGPGLILCATGACWWAWRKDWWSGRKEWWTVGLLVWWKQTWPLKVVGLGPMAWVEFVQTARGRFDGKIQHTTLDMVHCHNDYLQILFERGLLAFVALVGFLSTTAWRLSHAGPDGHALLLVGVVLCAIAAVSFPWTGYVLIGKPEQQQLLGYGTPALNYISWVMLMLVEVIP